MTKTLFLGLTGSIGMGKSTTAQMFRDAGIPVYDSDATVHALYEGEAAPLIEGAFPGTTNENGVDRSKLGARVIGNEQAMKLLETIIHPLVRRQEQAFREKIMEEKVALAILDIPLLFETGGIERVDGIIVVTAPPEVQKERVLKRENMTEKKFNDILARQTPDEEKRDKANFVIDTSLGMDAARDAVNEIIRIVTTTEKLS